MTVLVDTSVWSLLYRRKGPSDHPKVDILRRLLNRIEDVTITGSILQEILQAFRADSQFEQVSEFFKPFDILELHRSDFVEAARLHRRCASKGVAVTTVDCQIAIAAIQNECLLLTADRDFEHIAKHSDLQLV